MALGCCTICEALVRISPGELINPDTRQRVWYPEEHPAPDGLPCIGAKVGIGSRKRGAS